MNSSALCRNVFRGLSVGLTVGDVAFTVVCGGTVVVVVVVVVVAGLDSAASDTTEVDVWTVDEGDSVASVLVVGCTVLVVIGCKVVWGGSSAGGLIVVAVVGVVVGAPSEVASIACTVLVGSTLSL